jgi:hypothetical protein
MDDSKYPRDWIIVDANNQKMLKREMDLALRLTITDKKNSPPPQSIDDTALFI